MIRVPQSICQLLPSHPPKKPIWMDSSWLPKKWVPVWLGKRLLRDFFLKNNFLNNAYSNNHGLWLDIYNETNPPYYRRALIDAMLKTYIKSLTIKYTSAMNMSESLATALLSCDDKKFHRYMMIALSDKKIEDSMLDLLNAEQKGDNGKKFAQRFKEWLKDNPTQSLRMAKLYKENHITVPYQGPATSDSYAIMFNEWLKQEKSKPGRKPNDFGLFILFSSAMYSTMPIMDDMIKKLLGKTGKITQEALYKLYTLKMNDNRYFGALNTRWPQLVNGMSEKLFNETSESWLDELDSYLQSSLTGKEMVHTLNMMVAVIEQRKLKNEIDEGAIKDVFSSTMKKVPRL